MSEEKAASKTKTAIYKKWWFWVIIVLVLIGIGSAGAASNKDAKKVNEGDTTASEQSTENQTFKVGDTIAIDDREMTVKSVQRNYIPKYMKAGEGKEYVLVEIEFSNKSDEQISWMSSEWKMEDSNGAVESSAIGANDEEDILNYGELAPGGKKSGSIVFEVLKDDQKLKLHYQPNMFSDRKAIIEL